MGFWYLNNFILDHVVPEEDGWMDGWMDVWMEFGCLDGWVDGKISQKTFGSSTVQHLFKNGKDFE